MDSTTHRRMANSAKTMGAFAAAVVTVAVGCVLIGMNDTVDTGKDRVRSLGGGTAESARFAPYAPTFPFPAHGMSDAVTKSGVKELSLSFTTSAGTCAPLRGGLTGLDHQDVTSRIGALRTKGGDVRVSFGGADGQEPAVNCTSASELARIYGKVIDTYKLTKLDFDIAGTALPDIAANTRRAQAIARIQKSHPGLDVSLTLPVMPEGLTQPGVDLIANARKNGVQVSVVNVMTTDYGASYKGDLGQYASQAATATRSQIKDILGLSDAAVRKVVAVTPAVGVNNVYTEIFTVDDAGRLVAFAKSTGLARPARW